MNVFSTSFEGDKILSRIFDGTGMSMKYVNITEKESTNISNIDLFANAKFIKVKL